jgi:hypothetical protein
MFQTTNQKNQPINQHQFPSVSSQAKESKESKDQCPTEDRNPHPTLRSPRECEGTDLTSANSPGSGKLATKHVIKNQHEPTELGLFSVFLMGPFFHLGKPNKMGVFPQDASYFQKLSDCSNNWGR